MSPCFSCTSVGKYDALWNAIVFQRPILFGGKQLSQAVEQVRTAIPRKHTTGRLTSEDLSGLRPVSQGLPMAQDTLTSMDKLDNFLIQIVRHFPWDLFPWAKEFTLADQRAFLLEVLQAVHSRDAEGLQECLEDWQATVEALHNPDFMKASQQPYDPGDYVPWEQVRGELDLSRDPEAGHS